MRVGGTALEEERAGRTAVHADDAVLYERGQGQPIEERIDALPGPQPLLVPHALYALQPESKQRIDVRGL